MKLPPEDPAVRAFETSVRRPQVLEALVQNGVIVSVPDPTEPDKHHLEKGDVLEVHELPLVVPGQMLKYLSRKFGVPLEDFREMTQRRGLN